MRLANEESCAVAAQSQYEGTMAPTPEAKKALDDMAKMIKEMSQDTPEEKEKVAEMKKQFEDFLRNTDDPKKMEELTQMMQMMTMMTADPTAMLAQGMAQAPAGAQAEPTKVVVVNPSRETNLAIKRCYKQRDESDWDGSIARLEKVLEERKEHQTEDYLDAEDVLKKWKGKRCDANIKAAVEARDLEKVKSLLEIAKTDEGGKIAGINVKGQPYCSEIILSARKFVERGGKTESILTDEFINERMKELEAWDDEGIPTGPPADPKAIMDMLKKGREDNKIIVPTDLYKNLEARAKDGMKAHYLDIFDKLFRESTSDELRNAIDEADDADVFKGSEAELSQWRDKVNEKFRMECDAANNAGEAEAAAAGGGKSIAQKEAEKQAKGVQKTMMREYTKMMKAPAKMVAKHMKKGIKYAKKSVKAYLPF